MFKNKAELAQLQALREFLYLANVKTATFVLDSTDLNEDWRVLPKRILLIIVMIAKKQHNFKVMNVPPKYVLDKVILGDYLNYIQHFVNGVTWQL